MAVYDIFPRPRLNLSGLSHVLSPFHCALPSSLGFRHQDPTLIPQMSRIEYPSMSFWVLNGKGVKRHGFLGMFGVSGATDVSDSAAATINDFDQ